MKKLNILLYLCIGCLGLQACAMSFRSTQFDLLMRAVNGPDEVPVEDLAWTLLWSGETFTMYPVILPDSDLVNFVNPEGTIVVSFDNGDSWQIIIAYGLIPDLNLRISKSANTLDYTDERGQVLFSHLCSNFVSSQVGANTIRVQSCEDTSGEAYENEIRVDGDGQVSQLLFMVHEDYPMITLTPKNLGFFRKN